VALKHAQLEESRAPVEPRESGRSTTKLRPRRSVVVVVGESTTSERPVLALAESLGRAGVETVCVGRENSPRRVASAVVEHSADAVDLCLEASGGVAFIRELIRELARVDRRHVAIVLHRTD
jgi:methylmalonyl-CoA mutase cobalamin-binding subunit